MALGFKGAALFSPVHRRRPDVVEAQGSATTPVGSIKTIANQIVVDPSSGRLFNFFVEILNFRNDDKGAKFGAETSR